MKAKHIRETLGCLVFWLVLCGLWAADMLCPDRLYSDWEKRMLAQRPEPKLQAVLDGSFGSVYEDWLTDQFPARDYLVALKTRCEILLGKKEIGGVYLGSDGYLFSENTKTADWVRLEEEMIRQYGADRVSHIKAPAAGSVLEDRLPRGVSFTGERDRIWEKLYEHRDEYIYYRTDHHWTMLGAGYAYEAWAEERGLTPLSPGEMASAVIRENFLGTHYARLHYAERPDIMEFYDPGAACSAVYDLGDSKLTGLYQPELLETEDAYRFFLDGNHPVVQIETGQPRGHLAVLKDSFANCLIPYLTLHYQKITVIDPRYFRADIPAWLRDQEVTDVLLLYQDTVRAVKTRAAGSSSIITCEDDAG